MKLETVSVCLNVALLLQLGKTPFNSKCRLAYNIIPATIAY